MLRRGLKAVQNPKQPIDAVLIGHQSFSKLKDVSKEDKIIKHGTVVFDKCPDIHPFGQGNNPLFPNTKNVVFDRCDENFVYYWLNKQTFPDLSYIFLNSHPCEPNVFHRFCSKHPHERVPIFLGNQWETFYERWGWFQNERMKNLMLVPRDEMMIVIDNFKRDAVELNKN